MNSELKSRLIDCRNNIESAIFDLQELNDKLSYLIKNEEKINDESLYDVNSNLLDIINFLENADDFYLQKYFGIF